MIRAIPPVEASEFPSDETALGISHPLSEHSSEHMQHTKLSTTLGESFIFWYSISSLQAGTWEKPTCPGGDSIERSHLSVGMWAGLPCKLVVQFATIET